MSEELGDYQREDRSRRLLICTRKQVALALTKADSEPGTAVSAVSRWDSFPDITREREGDDGVNSMGKLGRSLGKGWGVEKGFPV